MKKIFIIAFTLVFMLSFPMLAFAEDASANSTEDNSSLAPTDAPAIVEGEADVSTEGETFFGQLHAYFAAHSAEIGSCATAIAAMVLTFVVRGTTKKGLGSLIDVVRNVKQKADATADGQINIVEGLNGIVDELNVSKEKISKIGEVVDWLMTNMKSVLEAAELIQSIANTWKTETDKMTVETVLLRKECDALFDIVELMYTNNKNVPQGVKDIVTLKYANILKERNAAAIKEGKSEV